jgi:hypothetical protein
MDEGLQEQCGRYRSKGAKIVVEAFSLPACCVPLQQLLKTFTL